MSQDSQFTPRYLPLGDLRTLSALNIVIVSCLASLALREPCAAAQVQSIVVILCGVALVTQPPFLFGHRELEAEGGESTLAQHGETYQIVVGVVLVGTVFQVSKTKRYEDLYWEKLSCCLGSLLKNSGKLYSMIAPLYLLSALQQ